MIKFNPHFTKYLLCLILFLSTAKAESLINQTAPVVHHRPRQGTQWNLSDPAFKTGTAFQSTETNKDLPDSLPKIPLCASSHVRRIEVEHYTPQSDNLDFLFYSPEEPSQASQVNSYFGKAVSYSNTSQIDPETYSFQSLAQAYNIICLPTRFHFTEVNGKRFMEYREGESAWVSDQKTE